MGQGTTFVALDDSKRKIVAGILWPDALDPELREIPNEPKPLRHLIARLKREGPVNVCDEAACRAMTSIARSPGSACPAR